MNIQDLAQIVDTAAKNATAIEQLTKSHAFNEEESYAIQAVSIERRYARGEKFVGLKMGFTSYAKMEQMGVHDMIWGRLTDDMLIQDGETIAFSKFIHPRAEPEICFHIKKAIDKVLTMDDIPNYIDGVAAAIEIIDSRYQNFKFSLEDVIADNCSSAGFVVGKWQDVSTVIRDLKMTMKFDGEMVQEGSSKAILGNPWQSLLDASRLAQKYGQAIPADSYIMAGAATSAMYIKSGMNISVNVETLGSVGFKII
ncbi:MAG: 2-oxo-3-hexenedioate decarboxylase [Maribacter sp.]|jgi:2-oxo-3-hexenedioate decarboxylase